MVRLALLLLVFSLTSFSANHLQAEPPRFQYQVGDSLSFKVEQATRISETLIDEQKKEPVTTEKLTKLSLIKNWKIVEVDMAGNMTVELRLTAMKLERQNSSGETDIFDSEKPDPDNKEEFSKWINKKLAVLKLDSRGNLIDVKESNYGPKSRFITDLPFKITLPEKALDPGLQWTRSYVIKLEPPQGTGETYTATQEYTAKEITNGLQPIAISTTIKDLPKDPSELMPILSYYQEGNIYYQPSKGRYFGARLKFQKELTNHQGDGTKLIYSTTFAEDLIPAK